jgi:hypothetical protein
MEKKAEVEFSAKVKEKKVYQKPQAKKHKSAALISGSGCSSYSSRTSGNSYYY